MLYYRLKSLYTAKWAACRRPGCSEGFSSLFLGAAPFSKSLLHSEIKVGHLMDKRQSIHGNFNFTASVWLWWLRPPAWPDSRTLSGNYGNVIDCICAWLRHNPRVSKTGSEQTQHSPTALKILYLPVPLAAGRLPPRRTSAPSRAGGSCAQGERSHLGTHARPTLRWRLGRRWCVSACASDVRRWQRCQEVIFFSQSWSSHQALSGPGRAATPQTQLGWQMLIVAPPVSDICSAAIYNASSAAIGHFQPFSEMAIGFRHSGSLNTGYDWRSVLGIIYVVIINLSFINFCIT